MSARRYGLDNWQILWEYPPETLRKEFNGVGPDRWSPALRTTLSWILREFLEAVFIHDMDYVKGGDIDSFYAANRRLAENTRRLTRIKLSRFNPKRWFMLWLAPRLQVWTNKYGRPGFNWESP